MTTVEYRDSVDVHFVSSVSSDAFAACFIIADGTCLCGGLGKMRGDGVRIEVFARLVAFESSLECSCNFEKDIIGDRDGMLNGNGGSLGAIFST